MCSNTPMKAYLSRWVCQGVDDNLLRVRTEALLAADEGAEMVVFPELFLTGYSLAMDIGRARAIFADVSEAAAHTLFVFGSISEDRCNRVTVWLGGRQFAASGSGQTPFRIFPGEGYLVKVTDTVQYLPTYY